LEENGVAPVPFSRVPGGLQAVVDDRIDAFVFDEFVLKDIVKTGFRDQVYVLTDTFDHYYVCIGMPNGSPLREPINRALLKVMETDQWDSLVERYLGIGG
jgi:ABC-type amino acid transport substrate-binding protein